MAGFLTRGYFGTVVLKPEYRSGFDTKYAEILDFISSVQSLDFIMILKRTLTGYSWMMPASQRFTVKNIEK